ncbi:MAG: T9SS type A sorting domain-containing protein [Bacteroidetes bacterium]|nr:T9SS type A sorting domain-containing protein [Bacteroidota bacterium]
MDKKLAKGEYELGSCTTITKSLKASMSGKVKTKKESNQKSVGEDASNLSVEVFPNPYDNVINVAIKKSGLQEKVMIKIYDISGSLVYSKEGWTGEAKQISGSDLQPGMAFLRVVHSQGAVNTKIVKLE